MSFMLVGHTKFSPNWCFGLLKQRYRRTFVSSLQDLVDVVNTSADVNTAQLVGTQDGEVVVLMYDWAGFLQQYIRKVPRMKSYHHFTFSSAKPGVVTMKEFSDSPSTAYHILVDDTWDPKCDQLHQGSSHQLGCKAIDSGTCTIKSGNSVVQVHKTSYAQCQQCLHTRSRSMRNMSQQLNKMMKLMPQHLNVQERVGSAAFQDTHEGPA